MSPPPASSVQVEPLSAWPPLGVGKPMSWHDQPLGQTFGGGGAPAPIATLVNVPVPSVVTLCEFTARPARTVPPRFGRSSVELDTGDQVVPSADVYAVRLVPERATRTHAGTV